MKFNFITTAISLTFFAFILALLYFPAKVPELTVENFSELFMVLVCIAVIIKIKNLKSSPKVYWILLAGASMTYLGVFIDFVEEFFDEQALDFGDFEDFIQTFGFITLFIGIQCWLSLHNSIMKNLKLISELDHLTGILNRRAFYQKVAEYKQITKGSLLLLDLDHFKQINDTYGHRYGDIVIKETAEQLKSIIRKQDLLARWGGEEFLIFLLDCDEVEAVLIANTIQHHMAQYEFVLTDNAINATVSIGVYQSKNIHLLDEGINHADEALYKAKANGRNCVEIYNS
jgi:diguanylate cyclase (GGDEF)-like protein